MTLPGAAKIFELPPRAVAEIGYRALMRGKRVAIAGLGNRIAVVLMHFLPKALLMRVSDLRSR
jgi:short-subunit dehydrogenase